ncbi:4-azaleucine resistance probable transporter AzlC [Formivibrio citricus]|uniref:4-azaleucine resistance probable transporter AzlC n=1 Tax=Formivibrio citricus TaxID=83765 RepID=A0A1I4Y412_9NEIS|nr:AzlC family ABC transporter permease [Formivibrio citricus]SFN32796.1 4-azaleucine resistance probable transporter AzlC [Formivibrio citricus]
MKTPASHFLAGLRDTLPMMVGAAPFGLIFGALAVSAGVSAAATIGMSALVFAGSSQFVAVSLLAAGAAWPVICLTTLVVNLRHALYSATLQPYAKDWPLAWRWVLSFWLTDETFAVVEHRFRYHGLEGARWYQLGSSLSMYGNWLLWTVFGVVLGSNLPGLSDWGLDFAMLATFAAIVAPQLRQRPVLAAAMTAGATALLLQGMPYKLDLMAAAFTGICAGLLLERLQNTQTAGEAA